MYFHIQKVNDDNYDKKSDCLFTSKTGPIQNQMKEYRLWYFSFAAEESSFYENYTMPKKALKVGYYIFLMRN